MTIESGRATIGEWIVDCVGVKWAVLAVCFFLMPALIALVDPMIGLASSSYGVFWLWRARQSWVQYRSARCGKSRDEWRHEEKKTAHELTTAARAHLNGILRD